MPKINTLSLSNSAHKIKFPDWINNEIETIIKNHFTSLIEASNQSVKSTAGKEKITLKTFNNLKNAFTDKKTKSTWEKLNSLSTEKSVKFASELFKIEPEYHSTIKLLNLHKTEVNTVEKIIKTAIKLENQIKDFKVWFYQFMEPTSFKSFNNSLDDFVSNLYESADGFNMLVHEKSILFFRHPLNRQKNGDNSLTIYYIRRIYYLFMDLFNKPLYKEIAIIVNAIFNSDYDTNRIIKLCRNIKQNQVTTQSKK